MIFNPEAFNIFQAFTMILFLYIFIFFLLFYLRLNKRKRQEDKEKFTFNFCLGDDNNYELYLSMKEEIKEKYNKENFMRFSEEIMKLLNHFEKIAIGINLEIFDEKIIKQYYKLNFIRFYKIYKYGIDNMRERNQEPYLLIEFEKLTRRWMNDLMNNEEGR